MSNSATSEETFETVVKRLRPRLHRYCARMCGSVVDGEDVVQEAILRAMRARAEGAIVQRDEAWLFRIAHNAALDHLRRQSRSVVEVQEDVDLVPDPESIESPLAASASLAVLMRLPTSQRSAVILMDVLGYSLKELSEIINASIPATKSLLHRGREALRHVVNDDADLRSATLDAADRRRLAAYVDKFNARDFDALRDMLSDDVKLELVAHSERRGKVEVGGYFSNYAKLSDWRMRLGTVENEHAVVVFLEQNLTPSYFILLEWNGERIARIRDFRYARYVMEAVDLLA